MLTDIEWPDLGGRSNGEIAQYRSSQNVTGSFVTLENLFSQNYRYRYCLEIRMNSFNYHYRYRLGVRSHPFISIGSQLPS